ncbi:MAG TPA: glycosyltransferase family 39 protein [Thermoanaerobaculia bacterium]|nr:glycosyltransferase family 39 protein [Thermoanaerobaculia bacterium]
MHRALRPLPWIAILLLAAAVRLTAVTAALPYMNYVDDGNYLHPVAQMLRSGSWDPGWYLYPTLPLAAVAAAARLYGPVYQAEHGRPMREDLTPPGGDFYDVLEPVELLLIGRVLCLIVSVGAVLLTGLLARRLAGNRAGLLAAFAAALVPALVIRSGIATVNPYAVFFTLACLLFADRLRTSSHPSREALAAGAMAGLAFASKYPAVLVSLSFAATVLFVRSGWGERLRFWVLGGVGAVAGLVLGIPPLLTNPRGVLGGVFQQGTFYEELPSPSTFWRQTFHRAEWDLPYEHPELGWPFLVLGLAGLALGAFTRDISGTVRAWWVYILVALGLYTRYGYQPFRNLLPLVPLLCIGVALLAVRIRPRLPRPLWADAAGFLVIAALFGPPVTGYALERWRFQDSRKQAVDWLSAYTGPGDTVLVLRELAFLPGELGRLEAKIVPRRLEAARTPLLRAVPRFVLLGEPTNEQGRQAIGPAFRRRVLDRYEIRARFGEVNTPPFPYWWHGNRQIVYVLERRDAAFPADLGAAPPWS